MEPLPHNARHGFLPFAICMGTSSTVIVTIRLYSRFTGISGKLGLDDAFMLLGYVAATICLILTVFLTNRYGYNRHMWDVPMEDWLPAAKVSWYIGWIYHVAMTSIKLSILLFYRRLVGGLFSKPLQIMCWSSLVFLAAYFIAFLVLPLNQCHPISASWLQFDMEYRATAKFHCASLQSLYSASLAISVCSVLTDFLAATIPALWFLTTSIQLQKSERIGLVAVFSMGYLTVGAGIAKAVYMGKAINMQYLDKTWVGYNAYVAGTVEGQFAILCASAPAIYKFIKSVHVHKTWNQESLESGDTDSKDANAASPIDIESPAHQKPSMQQMGLYGKSRMDFHEVQTTDDDNDDPRGPRTGNET